MEETIDFCFRNHEDIYIVFELCGNSNLFLMQFMFKRAKISLFKLSLRIDFKTLVQSFAWVILDT